MARQFCHGRYLGQPSKAKLGKVVCQLSEASGGLSTHIALDGKTAVPVHGKCSTMGPLGIGVSDGR